MRLHRPAAAAAAKPEPAAVVAGVRNMKNLANSSTVGSSRCRRGFYRTDSQTHTCDSDLRSLMSIDDINELVRALPTAIEA